MTTSIDHREPYGNIAVIGYGSAGRAFARALWTAGYVVETVAEIPDSPGFNRARQDEIYDVTDLDSVDFQGNDLLLIATPDRLIGDVAEFLARRAHREQKGRLHQRKLAFHLSGAHGTAPLKPLAEQGWRIGAFHPIQTFPPGGGADRFVNIHAGITGDPDALTIMRELARRMGVHPIVVPESERARYHLASVIVSNFLPLLLETGAGCLDGIAKSRADAREALLPLMRGMLESLDAHTPGDALTGPVARNDLETVRGHFAAIEDDETRRLYRELTRALVDLAERKGRLSAEQTASWRKMISGLTD